MFFCAEETFSGYAIPHSFLNVSGDPITRYGETDRGARVPVGIKEFFPERKIVLPYFRKGRCGADFLYSTL
ncbi:hypothetical protein FACS1894137_18330 [Spirochaetia bacterium]|nr:hypothetical protein FACS1894137_18330 [Spirochaetia bacterium]